RGFERRALATQVARVAEPVGVARQEALRRLARARVRHGRRHRLEAQELEPRIDPRVAVHALQLGVEQRERAGAGLAEEHAALAAVRSSRDPPRTPLGARGAAHAIADGEGGQTQARVDGHLRPSGPRGREHIEARRGAQGFAAGWVFRAPHYTAAGMRERGGFESDHDTPIEPGLAPPDPAPERALWFVFRGRELLVAKDGARLPAADPVQLGLAPRCVHYLGSLGPLSCFCAELPEGSEPPPELEFRDLLR